MTLATGETVPVTVTAPAGTPADQIPVPTVSTPVVSRLGHAADDVDLDAEHADQPAGLDAAEHARRANCRAAAGRPAGAAVDDAEQGPEASSPR